jgi:hypothetical protein
MRGEEALSADVLFSRRAVYSTFPLFFLFLLGGAGDAIELDALGGGAARRVRTRFPAGPPRVHASSLAW